MMQLMRRLGRAAPMAAGDRVEVTRPLLRRPLTVGKADDPLEREAEAIVDRVLRMPDPAPALAGGRHTVSQSLTAYRQMATGKEFEKPEEPYPFPSEPIGLGFLPRDAERGDEVAHRRLAGAGGALTAVSRPTSSGQRLPGMVRAWMEPRFGADLDSVRVHTDAAAGRAASAIHADAFTVGSEIYFAPGRYQPDVSAGRRLLAHELAHVLQSSPLIRRSLASAFANYRGSCDCGEDLGNNCAHYLSDAFIRSGYAGELDGGTGAKYRRVNGRLVCPAGRPVRAKQFRDWFASRASSHQEGEPNDSGHWAVYQERRSDGQGHVNIHRHTNGTYDWRGTTDLPTWRTQTHYSW
jgi:hypothetical protein